MRKRWSAAGMLVAEQQFRRIIGYRDLATLVIAIERHHMRASYAAPVPPNPRRRRSPLPPSEIIRSPDRCRSSTTIRTTSEIPSFQTVIDQFRATSLDNAERGDRFERLMQRYLRTDPLYADRFTEVWRWSEWPERGGKVDTGVDLVAEEHDGTVWGIQCKFYEADHTVSKADIDSFLSASGKQPFGQRLVISTTDHWGKNAEAACEGQQIPVQRIGLSNLAAAPIDWAFAGPPEALDVTAGRAQTKTPRPHQQTALAEVLSGFQSSDRGRLIMACGTGKTFTSLAVAEALAKDGASRLRVLFLVPSIALLSQTLREWTADSSRPMHALAVCSDPKVGKRRSEDLTVHDLAIPATTDPSRVREELTAPDSGSDSISAVFATYHSIDVIAQAQHAGVPAFDLIVCDEAHRTTGATLAGSEESHFVRVHDADYLKGARRLYMTATPRIFTEQTRQQADQAQAVVASMDDEALFGPEFHRLGFGEAVEKGLLTDYKVLVLTISGEQVADTLQLGLADDNHELALDDVAKIVGCWNGLAKRTQPGDGAFGDDHEPMRRAVAFAANIKASKQIASAFHDVVSAHQAGDDETLECTVEHVDGTYNALERNRLLDWLRAPVADRECRVLSNARCLSEGVDVPGLDAVLFLAARSSEVDVVQSVG
jgi:predicted helicase